VIEIEALSKSIQGKCVLAPITLRFAPHRTTVIIGPSGCGKTTLLRLILGLSVPDRGRVSLQGEQLAATNAQRLRSQVGYVVQDGGLFPHLTARRNVELMAAYLRRPADQVHTRCAALAELVKLPLDRLERYPSQLSGGERQRVALMRALMLDPPVLLLDEPLAALDPLTRHALQTDLAQIFARLSKTVVLVTHDLHEAAYLGDEILLMRAGRVVQRGTLDDLLERPAEPFVTDFIRAQRADARLSATRSRLG